MRDVIKTTEALAASWVNGNRKAVVDALVAEPAPMAALLATRLTVELVAAGGRTETFDDVRTLTTLLERKLWETKEVRR